MYEVTTTITTVQSRSTRAGSPMFEVVAGDGQTYTTFEQELAMRCAQFQGGQAQVSMRIETKPKRNGGQYTNVVDVAPAGQLPAMAAPQGVPGATELLPGTPVVNGIQPAPQIQPAPDYMREYSPGTQARLAFNAASSTAADFVGALYTGGGDEAWEAALERFKQLTHDLEEQQALRGAPAPQAAAICGHRQQP